MAESPFPHDLGEPDGNPTVQRYGQNEKQTVKGRVPERRHAEGVKGGGDGGKKQSAEAAPAALPLPPNIATPPTTTAVTTVSSYPVPAVESTVP